MVSSKLYLKDYNSDPVFVHSYEFVTAGATSCGNLYFTGNGDLMTTGTATAEELALSAAGVNRAPSTFWQYPSEFFFFLYNFSS